jgi:hypothetical protein
VIPAAGSAEDQTGKMTMMMDPLKPNNIMSHLPRPKPYQPFQVPTNKQTNNSTNPPPHLFNPFIDFFFFLSNNNQRAIKVETKKPVTPQQQAGAHVQKATQQQPLGRVLSPLVTAGTTTTTTTTTASSRPTAAASDDAAVAAQARLAAAAALVSKSVRKSADFNPNGGAAGSRGSLVGGGGGGDYYPGATTGFSSSSVSAVSAVHSKRSSYAGTPTCKTEFIHSINAPAAFTSPPAAAGSVSGHARYADPSSLPHHHHHQQQQPQQHHQFHYPVHPMEMVAAIHGSVSSLQQQQQNLRDSPLNSSKGSLYSAASECNEQQSHQQAQVMTRIKKSFEQKEEFLKRPALPYWVNVQEAQQSPPVPKEFYAQPQKFARPVWPPISASLTASLDSLSSSDVTTTPTQQQPPQQLQQQQQQHHKSTAVTKTEVIHTGITSMEPWSVSFTSKRATPPASPSQSPGAVGLGLVPNTVPKPFYGSTNTTTTTTTTTTVTASSNSTGSPSGNKQFVSTLSRIQENIAAEPPPEPKPSRQLTLMHAPLASPEEFFTPSPTKAGQHPLAASSVATATAAAAAPVVVKRTKPFENGAEKGLLARIAQRGKQQQEAAAVAAAAVAAAAAASAAAAERYSTHTHL